MAISAVNVSSLTNLQTISRINRSAGEEMWGCDLDFLDCNESIQTHVPFCVEVTKPDGTIKPLFMGVIPTQDFQYSDVNDSWTTTAYSFEYYLSSQFVPYDMIESQVTLNSDKTAIVDYENPTTIFKRLFFQYNHPGAVADTTKDFKLLDPLVPYFNYEIGYIQDVPNWGALKSKPEGDTTNYIPVYDPAKPIVQKQQFKFDLKTTKMQAIQTLADASHMCFFMKAVMNSPGNYTLKIYWVHEDDLDLYYPTPAPVTFLSTDTRIRDEVQVKRDHTTAYNRVTVHSVNPRTGYWSHQTVEHPDVTAGTRIPLEYSTETSVVFGTELDWTDTSTEDEKTALKTKMDDACKVEAQTLFDYFQTPDTTYILTIEDYFDLELLQKATFSGFDKVPETPLRITGLSYSWDDYHMIVEVTASHDQRLSLAKKMARLYGMEYTKEQQALEEDLFVDLTSIESGYVVAVTPYGYIVQLERSKNKVFCRQLKRA